MEKALPYLLRAGDQARRCYDQRERLEIYRQAEDVLVEEAPIIPLFYGIGSARLVKPWVRRFPYSAAKTWYWKDVILEPHD